MSATKRYKNTSEKLVEFKIWGNANMAPYEYSCEPGKEIEIPSGYAGAFMKRRAPGMTLCDELPEQPSAEAQAKLDEIASLAAEAEAKAKDAEAGKAALAEKLEADAKAKAEAEAEEAEKAAFAAELAAEEKAKAEAEEKASEGGLFSKLDAKEDKSKKSSKKKGK